MPEDLSGPHVAAAFLCQTVLQEVNGVLSYIRIVDRFTRPQPGPASPAQPISVTLVIRLKKGGVPTGNYPIKLRVFKPDTQTHSVEMENRAFLDGDQDRGVNILMPFVIIPDEEGVFWIDVMFQEQRVTRIPFRVIFATAPSIQGPSSRPEA